MVLFAAWVQWHFAELLTGLPHGGSVNCRQEHGRLCRDRGVVKVRTTVKELASKPQKCSLSRDGLHWWGLASFNVSTNIG